MSDDLVAHALWLDMPPARKFVLAILCQRAELSTGLCWPGIAEIEAKASLSKKSVIEHLKGLTKDGWIRNGRRPTRPGMTMRRWVNSRRILTEGQAKREAWLAEQKAKRESAGEESTPGFADEDTQMSLLGDPGEDQDLAGEVFTPGQVKIEAPAGEAASHGIVTTGRSIRSSQQVGQAAAGENAGDAAAPDGYDPLLAFGAYLAGQCSQEELTRLARCEVGVEGNTLALAIPEGVDLVGNALTTARIYRCARSAGFKSVSYRHAAGDVATQQEQPA